MAEPELAPKDLLPPEAESEISPRQRGHADGG
jgi:hypothetical protein